MIISQVISSINETIRQIVNGLSNRLTAADNWGPEGEKFQVLTSQGPRDTDPPPKFMSIEDILKGISLEGDTSDGSVLVGSPGPPGPSGPPGTTSALLRGAAWSNGGNPVDLGGQKFGTTAEMQVAGTITACKILGRGTGSATIGVKKANPWPTSLVDITGGADAVITTSSNVDVSLSGWDVNVALEDVFEFELKSVSGFTQVQITLEITPT